MIFMSSPNTPALQKLHRLKGSSPDFYDQLSDVLYGEEYQQCVPILQGDDLVWLVDYLDKVGYHVAVQTLCLSWCRPSMVSILQVLLPGSVYVNSEAYAVPGRYSQYRIRFRLASSLLVPSRSPQEAMVTCTRGPSTVRGFASNVCECILGMDQKRQPKCVVGTFVSLFAGTNET